MQTYSILASFFTAFSFLVFLGIVYWAWSTRRKPAFALAALAPFAVPDEDEALRDTQRGA